MGVLTREEDLFKKYHDRLRRELHYAYWHLIIYKQLDKARDDYKNELMQAPEFFSFSEHSHAVEVIMRINRICEDNQTSLNIVKLLDYANSNINIFSDESYRRRKSIWGTPTNNEIINRPRIEKDFISQQRQKYLSLQKTNFKKMRNRVLAHIDEDDVREDILPYREYYIEVEELETIINGIDNTLKILGIAFDGSRYDKEFPLITEGMKNMFECIRRGLQQSEDKK
jgi:hypothetical protein